jgi:poly(A) polymerase
MKRSALKIIKTIRDSGYEAVFAGGCVRDSIMKIKPKDYDIATSATPDQIESIFKSSKSVDKSFGVSLVKCGKYEFEIATFRKDGDYLDGRRPSSILFSNMREDANRRDFTINSIFYDPIEEKYIDYFDGREDIKNKIIKFVGDPLRRISEDRLRMLRAIRFATKLDFTIEKDSFNAIKENASRIVDISPERIMEEFIKMLEIGKPRKLFELLIESNLLHYILPEVEDLIGVKQDPKWHPEGDAYIHTIMVLEELIDESIELQLSGLFHDLGKSKCTTNEDGRIHSKGHAKISSNMVTDIMYRLRFSNESTKTVIFLVENHMMRIEVKNMKKSTLKKFLASELINELIKLFKADANSSSKDFDGINFIEEKLRDWKPEEIKPKPLIDGYDLLHMRLEPGPIFSKILDAVSTEQLEGNINSKEQAIKFVKEKFFSKKIIQRKI